MAYCLGLQLTMTKVKVLASSFYAKPALVKMPAQSLHSCLLHNLQAASEAHAAAHLLLLLVSTDQCAGNTSLVWLDISSIFWSDV